MLEVSEIPPFPRFNTGIRETRYFHKREALDPGNRTQSNVGMSKIGKITGSRKVSSHGYIIYEVTVCHSKLGRKKVLRSEYPLILENQARVLAARWDTSWEKKQATAGHQSLPIRENDNISKGPVLLPNGHPLKLDTST